MIDINRLYETGQLFDAHYKLIKPLSTIGGSADVWLAIDVNTIDNSNNEDGATKVAIKIYRPKNIIDVEGEYQFRKEFKKVFSCHHENIIQPTYFSIYNEMPYLVLPYCPAGSSETLIGQLKSKNDIWKYVYDVASGLTYLHEHTPKIVHQDIKPANVLIDDNGNYAITDFGISAEMGRNDISEDGNSGTYAYMAPERFVEGTPPMPESDIWAFGATLFEIITGDAPFGNDGGRVQNRNTEIPNISKNVPESIKQLINSCLSYDPGSRPTARSIVDTVLKRRYSVNKRIIAGISVITVALLSLSVVLFVLKHGDEEKDKFNAMCNQGDIILSKELTSIRDNDGSPNPGTADELEKALLLYSNACNETDSDFIEKQDVLNKIVTIKELIEEIKKYERACDLADKAELTEMEDKYIEYSIKKDKHKEIISELIPQIR